MTVEAGYTLGGTTTLGFEEAVERVTAALGEEGFGVLTTIDVSATLKEKLGEETRPYLILGACNAPFAHQALQIEPDLGTLLPCNVVVSSQEDGTTRVSGVDPIAMLGIVERQELEPIAAEIRAKLERALHRVWEA